MLLHGDPTASDVPAASLQAEARRLFASVCGGSAPEWLQEAYVEAHALHPGLNGTPDEARQLRRWMESPVPVAWREWAFRGQPATRILSTKLRIVLTLAECGGAWQPRELDGGGVLGALFRSLAWCARALT